MHAQADAAADIATENAVLRLEVERLRILIEAGTRRSDTELSNLRAELAAIRVVERRYGSLVENVPFILFAGEPGCGITFMSGKFAEYTGGEKDSWLGQRWGEYVHPDDRDGVLRAWRRGLELDAISRPITFRIRNRAGEYERFQATGKTLRNARGERTEWFGALVNIADLGGRTLAVPT